MKSTTLVIMAAGMGSRFGGGIKQLEPMGPNGEIIMDYSIYDAIQAGFNKVVFVTRKDLLETFKEVIGNRIEKVIPVEYALQEIEDIPEGILAGKRAGMQVCAVDDVFSKDMEAEKRELADFYIASYDEVR